MALTDAVPGRAVPGLTSPGRLNPPVAATVTAGPAAGTGTAPGPAPGVKAAAGLPAGAGAAPAPAVQAIPAATVTAGPAAGSGTAPVPQLAVQILAALAAGTGTAPASSAGTATAGTGHAGVAAGAGQAPGPAPVPASTQHPAAPAGTGAAPAPAAAAASAGPAGPATGTGAAPAPAPAATSTATPPVTTGTGAAPQPAVQALTHVTAAAGLAAGTGTASQGAAYTGRAYAGVAAGTGTAPEPDVWAYSEVAGFVADSLVLNRVIELLGGGVPSTVPQCAGAIFRLGRAYDLGSPQPVVDLLMTLMGDGSRPLSWRADNRTLTIPVTILVPTTGNLVADRLTLAGARELLLEVINDDEFTVVWAPDGQNGGLNLVWDCFRAHAAQVTHDVILGRQLVSELTVSFDALPYGRSDQLESLEFDSPVTGQAGPVLPLLIDDYSTVASTTQVTWFSQSPVTVLYLNSARWRHELTDSNSPLTYSRTLPAALDLSPYGKLTFWLGLGAEATEFKLWKRNTPVTVIVKLTDNTGRTLSFSSRVPCNASGTPDWPVWNEVSLTIPQGRAFTYTNVTAYQIVAWNQVHTWLGRLELDATGYLSGLRATAPTSPKRPASIRGGTYVLYDIAGSAPAPLSIHCQLGFIEQQTSTQVFTLPGQPGTVNNYAAPPENASALSGDTVNFDGGTTGTWTGSDGAAANATLTASATQAHSGGFSMRMQPVTGGTTMTAASVTAANIALQGLPCSPGDRIAVRCQVRAGTTGRSVTLGAQFFTAGGAAISVVSITPVTDTSSGWTQLNGRVTAPATAAFARLTVTVATPATGEFHYVDDAYLAYAVQGTVVATGAGGGGGSTTGKKNAAGGGGGGECAWETVLDLNPAANHQYQVGARGAPGVPAAPNAGGTDGGDSWFTGASVTVRAHGGKGGAGAFNSFTSGAGGARGTGSSNSHHNDGGVGAPGNYPTWTGGGGGGGAGTGTGVDVDAGQSDEYSAGPAGPAGTPPVAGGAGDRGYPGQETGAGFGGDAGEPGGNRPGGGGAGSASDTQNHLGSYGGNGQLWMSVKSTSASSTFPALVVHKTSLRSTLLAVPVLSVGSGGDPPDGREYDVPPVDGQAARYHGTYTVVVAAWTWNGTAARNVTVTVRQYSNSGSTTAPVTISSSITPAGVQNGLFTLGEISLPVTEIAPDNTDCYFTIAVQSDNLADRFLDVLLLDSQGVSFTVSMPPGQGFTDYWFDVPEPSADLGRVLGSSNGRSAAVSVLGDTVTSGGVLRLDPGDNLLTVYSPAGMPTLEGDYFPHWYHERLA